jgi:RNA polymerase sigma-70 factor (ECF subfamily)
VPLIVWLIRIARNVAHEQLRDRASTQTVELSPEVADRLVDETANPERATIDLGLLTPAQRDVMALRLAGFKIREIAATLGKAEGTVKALQFAAAKRLREVMRP